MKIYPYIIGAMALLFAPEAPARTAEDREMENRLVDAVRLYDDEQFAEAERQLRQMAGAGPQNDAVWYYLGLTETALRKYGEAIEAFRNAVELDPHNYWYKERLATLYSYRGEEDLTIGLYENLLKEYPDKVDIYFRLLNLYVRQQQIDKALGTLDNIEAVMGKSEQIASTKYDLYRQTGRQDEAIKALEDYNREFSSPAILSMLGDYYLSEYEDSLALAYYQEAAALQSDYVPAVLGKSEVYRTTRKYSQYFEEIQRFVDNEAISAQSKGAYLASVVRQLDPGFLRTNRGRFDAVIDSALAHHSADSTLLSAAGMYYYSTDRPDAAKAMFAANSALHPESLPIRAAYIQALAYGEDWGRLRDESEAAYGDFPDEPAFLEYSSMASYNLGDYEGVIGNTKRILALKDTARALSAYSTLGDMYHLTGNEKSAYAAYEKALKINPSYAPALNNYAYYLSLSGKKLKKAYAMSKKTVEAEPDNPTYLDTFGWILYLQGKALEAKPFFKHAMLYGGKDSVTILDHYAEVLYALKEYDLAEVYWNQALAKNDGSVRDLEERVRARKEAMGR